MTTRQVPGTVSFWAADRGHRAPPQRPGRLYGWVPDGRDVDPSALLLSIPATPDGPVPVYTPIDHVPVHAQNAKGIFQGVVSYCAPHLPNLSGAMGPLGFKVCAIRGSVDPMVIVWHGPELVVFVRTSVTTMDRLGLLRCHGTPRPPRSTRPATRAG